MGNLINKDHMILITSFLSAIKVLLSAFDIKIEDEQINAIADIIAIMIIVCGIWKNTYTTKKSKKQKEILQQKGLM